MNEKAIGVFDSGVGGLTVLKELMRRLPGESTVYLGDTARVPYGTKSPEVVTRYSLANGRFLIGQQIKLLVVACNTASSVSLPALSRALEVPVLGVIEPGASAALAHTRSGKVGVIGTPGTIASGAYQSALARRRPEVNVLARACPLFVPLAEEGWTEGEVVELVAKRYLGELGGSDIDTLILGCTHYPLLKKSIARVIGDRVGLVDSAEATAEAVAAQLEADGQLAPSNSPARHRFFVTDLPERFAEVGARFLERPIETVNQVDIQLGA